MEGPSVQLEGGQISSDVREAIEEFETIVTSEREVTKDEELLQKLRDFTLSKALRMILDRFSDEEVISAIRRATQSIKSQRRTVSGNPIRVFRRTH